MTNPTLSKVGGVTPLVVGGIMFIALVVTAYHLAGLLAGGALILLLSFEGWTLVNKYPNDTISEIIWALSVRPMVPWLFGVGTGAWLMYLGSLSSIPPKQVWLALAAGFLEGHFFFQAQGKQEQVQATKVAEAAVAGAVAVEEGGATVEGVRLGIGMADTAKPVLEAS